MYIVRLHTRRVRGHRNKFGLHAARPTIGVRRVYLYIRARVREIKTEERRRRKKIVNGLMAERSGSV